MKTERLCIYQSKSSNETEAKIESHEFSPLTNNELLIEVAYSSLNFKDALAVTGRGKILRKFPLVPGIDLAGKVIESKSSAYKVGDIVLATGCGLGETVDGGYTQIAKVASDIVLPLPNGLSLRESMLMGTAGFTAGLCLERFANNDQRTDNGPILVTGASGGVGSIAVQVLRAAGYTVHATSARPDTHAYLKRIGAHTVTTFDELGLKNVPLGKGMFGGAIDTVGGNTLMKITSHVNPFGNIASVGLAESHVFTSSVMPHILRGVSILGISSSNCNRKTREKVWQKLATDWKPPQLEEVLTQTIALGDVSSVSADLLDRKCSGRILVQP